MMNIHYKGLTPDAQYLEGVLLKLLTRFRHELYGGRKVTAGIFKGQGRKIHIAREYHA